MLCKNPFMAGVMPFGCGQCLPCRINKRRQWMWRQYLEGLCHEQNCFITLTYSDEHLPRDGALAPRDLQLFFKLFRFAIAPVRIRYFAVGEYGEENLRPHYHISMFGVSGFNLINNKPVADRDQFGRIVGGHVLDSWKKGIVDVAEFNHLTAQYVAGYTVKKLTDRKNGRQWLVPEFARMSNRPGIGAAAMAVIGRDLLNSYQSWETGDVPSQLRIGNRKIPIGRYLLSKLRKEVGFDEEYTKVVRDRKSLERSIELQAVFNRQEGSETFKASFLKDIEGQIAQVEARAQLFKKRGRI